MLLALLLFASDRPAVAPAVPPSPGEQARRTALAHFAAGRLAARTDRPATAARELEAAARADPQAPEPSRELVKVYADLGRDAAAIRVARAVLAADPHDAATARRLGQLLFDGNRFAEAAAALKQAADSPRPDPADRLGILREWATAGERAGDWAGAEAALQRAAELLTARRADLRRSPRFDTDAALDAEAAGVHEQLGGVLTGGRKFPQAEAAYRDAARRFAAAGDPDRAARLGWHRARVLAAAGRHPDAVAVMADFLRLRPSTLAPYREYADWLRAAGRGADAPDLLTNLADRHPGEPRIRWVAAAETARADPDAGDARFRPLLAESTDPELAALFVQAFAAAGRADRIVAELNRPPADDDPRAGDRLRAVVAAVKADPGLTPKLLAAAATARNWPATTWELVGFLAERDNKPAEAEAALRQGLEDDPKLFGPLYDLLIRQRKWRAAVALCGREDARPRRGAGGFRLARLKAWPLAELGDEGRALEAIKAAVENAPEPHAARLEKARLLGLLGHPHLAVKECDAVAAEVTTPALVRAVRLQRSSAYLLLREFAASERDLRAVLLDDPDDALALNNLGYHLADEGRNLAEAEALIRRAVELDRADRLRAGSPEADRGTYLDSLGWVLFKRGDLPGAKAELEKAVGLTDGGGDPVAWDHLGDVRFRLGDLQGAKAAWRAADERYAESAVGRQFGRQAEVKRKLQRVP